MVTTDPSWDEEKEEERRPTKGPLVATESKDTKLYQR